MRIFPVLVILILMVRTALPARGGDLTTAFEAANRLYEQGKFPEAAASYEKLREAQPRSATLCFNAGDAWYRAGQLGRAVAAWRAAASLTPRDPSVRFNLNFVRKKISGGEVGPGSFWERRIRIFTLNEWAASAAISWWLWLGLLAWGEARPGLKRPLRNYVVGTGLVTLLASIGLTFAVTDRQSKEAVVVIPEAVVRHGPLDESQVFFQLQDGSEVAVLDEKPAADPKQVWLQVQESHRRVGWIKRSQVLVLP